MTMENKFTDAEVIDALIISDVNSLKEGAK